MIKRTLCFESPAWLSTKNNQLVICREGGDTRTAPLEDIGFIIVDHERVSLSKTLMGRLLELNAAVIITGEKHMPAGMMLPLETNTLQQERFRAQFSATVPLKKRLWQQTVAAKIRNQAAVITKYGGDARQLSRLAGKVLSGDSSHMEGQAARRYWQMLFSENDFTRGREGPPPNNLLNYGYAILRAIIARSICGVGLLPVMGVHHRNRYNAYPLADDIMEPYRPFVDDCVKELRQDGTEELDRDVKGKLLMIPHLSVIIKKERLPLMAAAEQTAVSLYRCFSKEADKIKYPKICTSTNTE